MYRWVFLIVAGLAIALGLVLGIVNAEPATLDLLFTQFNTTIGMIAVGAFATGLILGVAAIYFGRVLPLRYHLRKVEKQHQDMQKEVQKEIARAALAESRDESTPTETVLVVSDTDKASSATKL